MRKIIEATKKILKKMEKNEFMMMCIFALITFFIFANTFILKGSDVLSFYVPAFMCFPIAFIGLWLVKDYKGMPSVMVGALLVATLIPQNIGYINYYFEGPNAYIEEYDETAEWIRKNTAITDIFLVSPYSYWFALAERRTVVLYPVVHPMYQLDPREQFADAMSMYAQPSQELYEKYNISYVLYGEDETELARMYNITIYDFSGSNAFKPVFSNKNCTIFKLVDLQALPENTTIFSIEELAMERFSRWMLG